MILKSDLSNLDKNGYLYRYINDLRILAFSHAKKDNEKGLDRVESHLRALGIKNADCVVLSWELQVIEQLV